MKVLLPAPVSLLFHFTHCQAYYLISLASLHYDISLSKLKANLQRHTTSENSQKSNQALAFLKCGQRSGWLLDVIGDNPR